MNSYTNRYNTFFQLALGILFLALACYLCFFDINRSITYTSDENLHVQVTQEMWQSGQWWLPTHAGEPYFRKPPLKMWLTFIPLSIWGESNFAYRFIDASLGVLLVTGIAAFTYKISGSFIIGLLAGCLYLISGPALISSHGFRYATQDTILRFFQFTTLWIFYIWHQNFLLNKKSNNYNLAILLGLSVAISIFSKNVLGFVAPSLAALFLIVRKEIIAFIKNNYLEVLLALVISISIPAAYMLPHFIYTDGAFENMFLSEVVERSVTGQHHKDNSWYYLIRLWQGSFIPAGLLVAGILVAIWQSWQGKAYSQILLIWATVPVLAFSLPKSRLFWYIGESLVAIAILAALAIHFLLNLLRKQILIIKASPQKKYQLIPNLGLMLILVLLVYPLPKHLTKVINQSTRAQVRLPIDQLVQYLNKYQPNAKIAVYAPGFFYHEKYTARDEKFYLGQLNPRLDFFYEQEKMLAAAKSTKYDYIIISRELLEKVTEHFKQAEYMVLPQTQHRKQRAFVLARQATGSHLFRMSKVAE